jgi:RNase H-fold protein (predicted Holliday junction resolvase)
VRVLGVDPGTRKVGWAIVDEAGSASSLGIDTIEAFPARAHELRNAWDFGIIAVGTGTNSNVLERELSALGLPIVFVDERETTLRARSLYFTDHPPRGWRRLIPLGMQLPPRPIDDYAALLIARRYFADEGNRRGLV